MLPKYKIRNIARKAVKNATTKMDDSLIEKIDAIAKEGYFDDDALKKIYTYVKNAKLALEILEEHGKGIWEDYSWLAGQLVDARIVNQNHSKALEDFDTLAAIDGAQMIFALEELETILSTYIRATMRI